MVTLDKKYEITKEKLNRMIIQIVADKTGITFEDANRQMKTNKELRDYVCSCVKSAFEKNFPACAEVA